MRKTAIILVGGIMLGTGAAIGHAMLGHDLHQGELVRTHTRPAPDPVQPVVIMSAEKCRTEDSCQRPDGATDWESGIGWERKSIIAWDDTHVDVSALDDRRQ